MVSAAGAGPSSSTNTSASPGFCRTEAGTGACDGDGGASADVAVGADDDDDDDDDAVVAALEEAASVGAVLLRLNVDEDAGTSRDMDCVRRGSGEIETGDGRAPQADRSWVAPVDVFGRELLSGASIPDDGDLLVIIDADSLDDAGSEISGSKRF